MGELKKYPLVLLFFGGMLLFVLIDMLMPDRGMSAFENRVLTQRPVFDTEFLETDSFGEGYQVFSTEWSEWAFDYNEYAKDQLLLRDSWINMQSAFELAQGKLENGGVWFAKDSYLIAKNNVFTAVQEANLPLNTRAVCELAQRHEGKVTAMIVPSPANVLSDKLKWDPPQIDENSMLDSIYAQMEDSGATVIDLRDTFASFEEESVYYRTDHHWTTETGAALGYIAYCESQGISPQLPPEDLLTSVPDFLGTNYAKSKKLGTEPENLSYYNFPNLLTVYAYESDDTLTEEAGPIMDASKLDTYDKYAAFLRGNNGYSEIEGNGKGSILLIKDSYGNCFAPYLIEDYARIGIIDLRAWFSVDETIAQNQYDEILVLYSFDNFSSDAYARRMLSEMQ